MLATGYIDLSRRKEPLLLLRTVKLERKILSEQLFESVKDIPPTTLEQLGPSCCIMIGPHRFSGTKFYIPLPVAPSTTRRSSLAMVQMLLSGTKKDPVESPSPSEPQTPPQPSASNSIKDLLAKSPGLVQLLNGTLAQNKRPVTQSMTAKPRPVYFCLPEKQSLLLFPSSAVMEVIGRKGFLYDLMIPFWPSQVESTHPLTMIIRGVGEDVYEALLTWTRDPVRLFAEYLPKITVTPNICYREIQLPCTPPCEVSPVNLIKTQQPQKNATLPSSTRQARPARRKIKKHD